MKGEMEFSNGVKVRSNGLVTEIALPTTENREVRLLAVHMDREGHIIDLEFSPVPYNPQNRKESDMEPHVDVWVRWEDSKWHLLSDKIKVNPNPGSFAPIRHFTICGDRVFTNYVKHEGVGIPDDEFDVCQHCSRAHEMRKRD